MPNSLLRRFNLLPGFVLALCLIGPGSISFAADAPVPEPDGYRMDDYKSPTPLTVKGGKPIDTATAQELWRGKKAIFVDVLPAPIKPAGLAPDQVWAPKPHRSIQGSTWLPEVGRGGINETVEAYFKSNLTRLTNGNLNQPIVFYCLASCWMSYNATKRAATYGYTTLYWYRDGIDGWDEAQMPVETTQPAPGLN